jgi:hypothetical protein
VYIKTLQKGKNGRLAYEFLFYHYLGPNNFGNMANAAKTKLSGTLYNGEKKRFTWETYVRIHTEQNSVLNGLNEYGYSGIDDSSKVHHLLKGIKTTELDVCKAQVMASPTLRDDVPATVELYSTFIKKIKAQNPQLNVSEVSYARKSGGGKGWGKRSSSGISNNFNGDVADRFFEKHEYHTLTPEQKNNLRLKRLKRGYVGNGQKFKDSKRHAKCSQSSIIKKLQCNLDSHADACVVGKEALIFNDFDREVTVSGYDPNAETNSLRTVSSALGYVIPETGNNVSLIVQQAISLPTLDHNLLSTMQMRLNDVVVNETPKFQSLEPTSLLHTISVRGDDVDDVLVIPLHLFGVVSCFPTFKPSQEEFETCPRYELTYQSPVYDPTVTLFSEQEASMTDSYGKLKPSGDSHPKRRQVCSLRQKEPEVEKLSVSYSDTLEKFQDLSIVLDDNTLIAEVKHNVNISDVNLSSIHATMRDNGGVDAATLANNFWIGIEAAKRTRLVTTQGGLRKIIHPSFNKRYKTNDRQLRYFCLPVILFTDTMY